MINTILEDLAETLPYLPICFLAGLLFFLLFILCKGWSYIKSRPIRIGSIILFFVYFTGVCFIALLSREPGSRASIDMDLFSTWGYTVQSKAYVIENVLFFIPFGLLLPTAFPGMNKFHRILAASYLCSFGVELTQLLTKRGYYQIDDILTNVLGACIGFFLARLIHLFYKIFFR